eukprot:275998-Amphidinium_carterae.2
MQWLPPDVVSILLNVRCKLEVGYCPCPGSQVKPSALRFVPQDCSGRASLFVIMSVSQMIREVELLQLGQKTLLGIPELHGCLHKPLFKAQTQTSGS